MNKMINSLLLFSQFATAEGSGFFTCVGSQNESIHLEARVGEEPESVLVGGSIAYRDEYREVIYKKVKFSRVWGGSLAGKVKLDGGPYSSYSIYVEGFYRNPAAHFELRFMTPEREPVQMNCQRVQAGDENN